MHTSIRLTLAMALLVGYGLARGQDTDAVDLESAIRTETIEGDLRAAIERYESLVDSTDRAIAAEALLRMGGAYEKLGSTEARNAYGKLLNEYADQIELAREARIRLSALTEDKGGVPGVSGPTIRRIWDGPGEFPYFGRVSGDGRYYAHAVWSENGGGNLAVRDLESGDSRVLTSNEAPLGLPYSAVVSPDNRQVVYVWWAGPGPMDLRTVALDGTGARVLYESSELVYPEVFDWSPDGSTILAAFQRPDGTAQLVLVALADGSVRVLKSVGWRWPNNMSFSPDGRFIVYDLPQDDASERDIFALAVDGSQEVTIVDHPSNDYLPFWTPDGSGIVFASDRTGTMDMWRLSIEQGRAVGEAELVQRDLPFDTRGLSRDGVYYYLASTSIRQAYLTTLTSETEASVGASRSLSPDAVGRVGAYDWSPDGRRLVYTVRSPISRNAGGEQLFVRDLETGEEHDVMPDQFARVDTPRFSPDGQRILVFATTQQGRQGVYVIENQEARRIALGRPVGWSPDGQLIYATRSTPTGRAVFATHSESGETVDVIRAVNDPAGIRILVRDPESNVERVVFQADTDAPTAFSPPVLSPDGQSLAILLASRGPDDGLDTLTLIPVSGGDPREFSIPNLAQSLPVWTSDSANLLVVRNDPDSSTESLWQISAEAGVPEPLGLAMEGLSDIRIHPDGKRLAFTAGSDSGFELWAMEGFLH